MKILYTYQGIMQKVGGVSRYFYENILRIQKQHQVEICTRYLSNVYFSTIMQRPHFAYRGWQHIRLQTMIEDIHLVWHLLWDKYDIVHLTAEESHVFRWTRKPVVITIHDMVPEMYYKEKKRIKKRAITIHKANAIICVSENTKRDLLKIYPEISVNKINVIYHGHTSIQTFYQPIIDNKYILFVGSRYGEYKNFNFFLFAIAPILRNKDFKLVCTGNTFSDEEKKIMVKYNIHNKVINHGFVSDENLANLYHYAECFVYPSLYEGFGIPILEAFSHGCPACISNTSCFPEVGGNAVAYFDPKNEHSIRQSITKVIEDREYRQSLIERGRKRIKLFSWDIAAEQTIKIYENVLK